MIALPIAEDPQQVLLEAGAEGPVQDHFPAADVGLYPCREISTVARWQIITASRDAGQFNNRQVQTSIDPTFPLIIVVVQYHLPINQ